MPVHDIVDLIPVACSLGAPDPGVARGPQAVLAAGLIETLQSIGLEVALSPEIHAPGGPRWEALSTLCTTLAARVHRQISAGRLPLVLGGDHALAVGTWNGMARALDGPPGLIWIDAHLDAHTPDDSPSGNPHGMPVAMLLGEGDPRLARACIAPQHLCLLGGRSWEPAELARLARLGGRIYGEDEILRHGLHHVLADARARVTAGTAGFGISVDMDVFSLQDAPGVNSPAPGGLSSSAWLAALNGLAQHPRCRALEIVECDGLRDRDGQTAQLACALARALLTPFEWNESD